MSGLVAYWKLDDASGTSATDSMRSNTGTWNGTLGGQWTTGKFNGGSNFGGANYISLSSGFMATTGAISVCAWIYPTGYGTGASLIAQRASELTSFPQNWSMYINSTSHGLFFQSSANSYAAASGGTVALNAWQLVCGTYTGTGTKVRTAYLNAVQVGQVTNTTDPPTSIGSAVPAIGAGGTDNSGPYKFLGKIDEVGIWNRALSSSEVSTLYKAGSGNPFGNSSCGFSY